MKVLREKPYLFIFIFISTYFVVLGWHLFIAGEMTYFDAGLINDFMSDVVHGNFVTSSAKRHLPIHHFTPVLYLFSPLFYLWDSQFIFYLFSIIFPLLGCLIFTLIFDDILAKLNNGKRNFLVKFLVIAFFLFIALNKYFKSVLFSFHYESLFILFTSLLFLMIYKNKNICGIIIMLFLALGVREDAGIYLSVFFITIRLVPKRLLGEISGLNRTLIILTIISLTYTFTVVEWVKPLFNTQNSTDTLMLHFWGKWGESLPQIIINMLLSPIKIINIFLNRTMFDLNRSFFLITFFNPLLWFFSNVMAIMYYLVENDPYKSSLAFYNTSFMMPGLILALMTGIYYLYDFSKKTFWRRKTVITYFIIILLSGAITYNIISIRKVVGYKIPMIWSPIPQEKLIRYEQMKKINKYLEGNNIKSVATTDRLYMFLDNPLIKFRLSDINQAQAVIIQSSKKIKNNDELTKKFRLKKTTFGKIKYYERI